MKKVGLMTCYMNNFGACLQAFALQKTILDLDFECEIIKYTPVRSLKEYSFPVKIAIELRRKLKSINNIFYRYEAARSKCFKKFKDEYLIFGKPAFNELSDLYKSNLPYDLYVVGSDQLWNPLINGQSNNKAYFLDFVPKGKKRIAYAPSIGISLEHIPQNCVIEMGELLRRFDSLSTREVEGKRIVENISGRDCRVVLDPTLLVSADYWKKLSSVRKYKKPYIFCYVFSEREYIGKFIEYVHEKLNIDVVMVPLTKRDFSSKYIKMKKVGPKEFISLIQNAALVITDSFHATAFSINLNVPFYSLMRNTDSEANNMNSRIDSILSITNLENRKIASAEDFPESLDLNMNFENANSVISRKRCEDMEFLKKVLEE